MIEDLYDIYLYILINIDGIEKVSIYNMYEYHSLQLGYIFGNMAK